MGKTYPSLESGSIGLKIIESSPVDDRMVVDNIDDLFNFGPSEYYNGIRVSVIAESDTSLNGIYFLPCVKEYVGGVIVYYSNKQSWDSTLNNYDPKGWRKISDNTTDTHTYLDTRDDNESDFPGQFGGDGTIDNPYWIKLINGAVYESSITSPSTSTSIYLPRTTGAFLKPGITPLSDNIPVFGSIKNAEPWVQESSGQLWVDNICINPRLSAYTTVWDNNEPRTEIVHDRRILRAETFFDEDNNLFKTDFIFNLTELYSELGQNMYTFNVKHGNNTYPIYKPLMSTGAFNLQVGDNMRFTYQDSNTDIINKIDAEFIKTMQICTGNDILDMMSNGRFNIKNISAAQIESRNLYALIQSTFLNYYAFDVTKLVPRWNYSLPTDNYLVHDGVFNAVTSIIKNSHGDIEVVTQRFHMPSAGSGSGTAINQTISAQPGSPISGAGANESYESVIYLSGDQTPISIFGAEPDNNGCGTDIRLKTEQDANRDRITLKVNVIDGGLISLN